MIGAEVQKSIYSALSGASVASGRIYDEVPGEPVFPYVTIGDEQIIDDGNTCQDGWEVYPDVHCWSRSETGSKVEVKTLAAAVVTAVTGIASIAGFSLVSISHETTRVFRDPDGLTEHAVVSFRALIDPA
jgi:hypothetical protein